MRPVTRRIVAVEAMLAILVASRLLLDSLGERLNAERIRRSIEKLGDIPEAIAGWEWDRTVTDKMASMVTFTGGGYDLVVRCYVRPESDERVYFQVCRWLDPLSCYELHGWRIVRAERPVLVGEDARVLRRAGVKEGWVERNEERMGILFWESDLLEPGFVREGALIEDAGAKGRLSKLFGRTQRRIRSFFKKSDIVVKVIYPEESESEETREAVLRFACEVHRILPDILR